MWECSSGKQKPGTQHHSQVSLSRELERARSKGFLDIVAGAVLPGEQPWQDPIFNRNLRAAPHTASINSATLAAYL